MLNYLTFGYKILKMIKKYNFILLLVLFVSMLASCSKENKTESLIEEKLETMSGKEMLRELLIKNDNDIYQLARIFECSPSSLKRILEGETFTTTEAEKQFKNALNQTLITKEKTLNELDPIKQSWSYNVKFFIENHYVWLIVMLCIVFILTTFELVDDAAFFSFTAIAFSIIVLLSIVIYVILIIYFCFKNDPVIIDNFKNTFDPIWEQLK